MTEEIKSTETSARRNRTIEEAVALVDAWRTSDLSKDDFCRQRGIVRSSLTSCLQRVEKRESQSSVAAGFVEVRPRSSPSCTALTLEIDGAYRVVGMDMPTMIALISALRSMPR